MEEELSKKQSLNTEAHPTEVVIVTIYDRMLALSEATSICMP
jgi:hypothetical protein